MTPITFQSLRSKGFRLCIPFGDFMPHMRIEIDRKVDSFLELGRAINRSGTWSVFIVSEMARSYGKFCFLRDVSSIEQLQLLYESLTDQKLPDVEWSPDEFETALRKSTELCQKQWDDFYTNESNRRHVLIPS